MIKINNARAARHRARSTPDRVERVFNRFNHDAPSEYQKWAENYQRLMRIKHGKDVKIQMSAFEVLEIPWNERFILEVQKG